MKRQVLFVTLGFWALVGASDFTFMMVLLIVGSLFLWLMFHQKFWLLIWTITCLVSVILYPKPISAPQSGIYTVDEIKSGYVVASQRDSHILLYDLPNAAYEDQYEVKHFDAIHSLKNIGSFSFETYLKGKGIGYQGYSDATHLVQRGRSLRARIYKKIKTKDLFLTECLYGIYQSDSPDLMRHLSLPLLSFLLWIERCLKRYFSLKRAYIGTFLLALVSGSLFVYTTSILRFVCQRFSKIFWKEWEYRFACTTFLFLILVPDQALSFAFVLPALFSLLYGLCQDAKDRVILSKVILFGLQFLYFHQVDWITTLCYSILRKWSGYLVLVLWIGLWFPIGDVHQLWIDLLEAIPSVSWEYEAGVLFLGIWLMSVYYGLKPQKCFMKKISLMIVCGAPFVLPYFDPFFRVTVFSIGNGDCTLITEPFHKSAVLIDCGQNLHQDNMKEIVVPYLRKKHIDYLDAVIITHEDFDHCGGLESLQKRIPIQNIITDSAQPIPVKYPFYSLLEKRKANDENERSLISYFSYDSKTFLWTGDASIHVEKQLIKQYPNLKVDLIKVGHHGSKTSSSSDFLYSVQPKLALISSGYKNRYGHPDTEVLRRLKKQGISSLNTADVGMIEIYTLFDFCFFRTGTQIFGIIP